jgi:hypothetical protein
MARTLAHLCKSAAERESDEVSGEGRRRVDGQKEGCGCETNRKNSDDDDDIQGPIAFYL